jgi:hypothetical protein
LRTMNVIVRRPKKLIPPPLSAMFGILSFIFFVKFVNY